MQRKDVDHGGGLVKGVDIGEDKQVARCGECSVRIGKRAVAVQFLTRPTRGGIKLLMHLSTFNWFHEPQVLLVLQLQNSAFVHFTGTIIQYFSCICPNLFGIVSQIGVSSLDQSHSALLNSAYPKSDRLGLHCLAIQAPFMFSPSFITLLSMHQGYSCLITLNVAEYNIASLSSKQVSFPQAKLCFRVHF